MEFFPVFDLCRCGMIILLNEGLCWLWNNKLIFSDITAVGIFNYTNRHVLWCHQERRSYQIQYPSQNGKLSGTGCLDISGSGLSPIDCLVWMLWTMALTLRLWWRPLRARVDWTGLSRTRCTRMTDTGYVRSV